ADTPALERHGLPIVEDACEALGAVHADGTIVGSRGHSAVFAFYANKQLATGEGGMVVTGDEAVADRIASERNQGRAPDMGWLDHDRLGFNYRMSELQAALGVAQLGRLDQMLADRATVAGWYREALAGTKLSAEGRRLANQRLGRMLKKLGRDQEAQPFLAAGAKGEPIGFDDFGPAPQEQDVEREKALREKARALVQQILAQQGMGWSPPLHGIGNTTLAEQLLWIGEAAVPEVIAALQAEQADLVNGTWSDSRRGAVQGLAGFLWRTGGTVSAAFLWSCTKVEDPDYRAAIVATAFQAEQPAMLAEAARFLNDPDADDRVVKVLLQSGGNTGAPLGRRLDPTQIIDAALRGPQRGKIRLLAWARQRGQFDSATLPKLHGLVREGLKSTDPEFGSAANQFLLSTGSQDSLDGLLLLLQELPRMKGQNSVPNSLPQPSPETQRHTKMASQFTTDEAAKLLPAIDTCARALGTASEESQRRRHWLEILMCDVARAGDATVVPTVLAWMDLGYKAWYVLDGRVTAANSKDVFARFDRIAENEQVQFVAMLARVELPTDLFPLLRDKADQLRRGERLNDQCRSFVAAMAATGDPDAALQILAEFERVPDDWFATPLIALGRRTKDEQVRAAMRTVAGAGNVSNGARNRLLLALLSMHDVPALDPMVERHGMVQTRSVRHPYAVAEDAGSTAPLQYLVYQNPDPPHGFTEDEVIGVLRKIAANGIPDDWQPRFWSHTAIPDRLLAEFATLVANRRPSNDDQRRGWANWISLTLDRERAAPAGALAGWGERMLRHVLPNERRAVLDAMGDVDVHRLRTVVETLIDDGDEGVRRMALAKLYRCGLLEERSMFERLLRHGESPVHEWAITMLAGHFGASAAALVLPFTKSPNEEVRLEASRFLGSVVSKDAVPELIALLRDPDERVRTAASDALTRIRFYHEQQAHWDRVLKGLDASPASAAEKLLLQAKPGAPREQRLLAITSLGTLGVPEALPFLIEWTTDPDAELAGAAKAAITQIHLNPRK
ncbi:MAG: DegT/DnrJ/EryC1/StrS family aminotransferase, partial [Planctomycetota bacterium]|nr:DegT/DnrJ/EryC1/StrS family aminotransferase [Planctomycetota bacterium]